MATGQKAQPWEDRYELCEDLGEGGNASVFHVREKPKKFSTPRFLHKLIHSFNTLIHSLACVVDLFRVFSTFFHAYILA